MTGARNGGREWPFQASRTAAFTAAALSVRSHLIEREEGNAGLRDGTARVSVATNDTASDGEACQEFRV